MVVAKSKTKSLKSPAKSAKSSASKASKGVASKSTKSAKVHTSKVRAKSSRLARSKTFSRKSYRITRRTVLVVVILSMIAVILAVLFTNLTNPERLVKGRIEAIASDYYENYFYEKLSAYATDDKPIEKIISNYADRGFSKTSLRQLLLFDGERHGADAPTLTYYCDENDTSIQIFPVAPYTKSDYRIEYNYSCIF